MVFYFFFVRIVRGGRRLWVGYRNLMRKRGLIGVVRGGGLWD